MMEEWNSGNTCPIKLRALQLFAVAIYQHSNLPIFQPSSVSTSRLHLRLVNVAPAPVLARFERLNDRVRGAVKMFSSVPVRRGVTAAHMTAGQA
jgi:hypothetical protein